MERVRHFVFNRNGADQIDANGDGFSVDLNQSISVPSVATNCTVATTHATIWNITPNIGPGLGNNKLRVSGQIPVPVSQNNVVPGVFDFTMEFEEGIYNVETLNEEIQRQWTSGIYTALGIQHADQMFDLTGNESNGRCVITATRFAGLYSYEYIRFWFEEDGSIAPIVGFTSNVELPRTGAISGEGIARFNTVEGFIIICPELASAGIPINGKGVGAIARIPIFESSAGSILQYEPYEPFVISGQHLVNQEITRVTFLLRNQLLQPVVMREDWSVVISIRFNIPE